VGIGRPSPACLIGSAVIVLGKASVVGDEMKRAGRNCLLERSREGGSYRGTEASALDKLSLIL
jgi:hypothetical protein